MNFTYEEVPIDRLEMCKEICNELMVYQKSLAYITPERFDNMTYETRLIPSVEKAQHNYLVVVKNEDEVIGYVYSNISPKEVYSSEFATFFDMESVEKTHVGCLSQFYIKDKYRQYGIGSKLFSMSMDWLKTFNEVEDYFIFVSNGNEQALEFYKRKGFFVSHAILAGFITILKNKKAENHE
ncbi:GNAT family N-acetyltransferase [Sutcliffiella horikoshii]|uniref:GNAT family N-acetyltransferase n=1 Tax=Sutcliffiella horikoshii TaxID=79883 RepID=A0AA95B4Q0_9BACI|nr:GNAT family N-acetyltransferase [Sutcliffiella horikoshii]TYS55887.1 GNAT family N-acetyltransferase [Sutcliffiella horikoshii]